MPETQVSGSPHSTLSSLPGWRPPQTLVLGAGALSRVGELARDLGSRHVLLVTDAGIVAAGHATRARQSLEAAGLKITLFDRVRENPTTKCVNDCVALARPAGIDTIIGLGGGSSMDTAKGCNFILTNGGRMHDYRGIGKATKPMLPFIAIPTTAGTGSEMQSAALIADEITHEKMACLDSKCAAKIAILDPDLTLSQPPRVTACTGIDAIAHAVETAVTTKRNELSQRLSHEGFNLCARALPEILKDPAHREARARMQRGAAYAGAAIENSMLGAAHAAANPLTARHGIVHGEAVGIMLPHVVRFNAADPDARASYAALARSANLAADRDGKREAAEALAGWLESLLNLAGVARSLDELSVPRQSIKQLAAEACEQWTGTFNPRPVGQAEFESIYEAAFGEGGNGGHR